MSPFGLFLGALAALAVTALAVALWRPARNTAIQLRHTPTVRCVATIPFRPEAAYPIEYVDQRERVRAGYYAMPPFDAMGIPMVDYTWMRSAEMPAGRFYNPVTVAQYALWGCFMPWTRTGDPSLLREFLKQADWLVQSQGDRGEWAFDYAVPARRLAAGWVSGMGQGQATSVLIRASLLTGETRFLDAARKAVDSMLRPLSEGGALSTDESGTWLEEYPEDPPSHVLNGLVFAWWGLYDYLHAAKDARADQVLGAVDRTLLANIDRYTAADGSARYELKRPISAAENGYLDLQIAQLVAMAHLTGSPEFLRVSDSWRMTREPSRQASGIKIVGASLASAVFFRLAQLKHGSARRNPPASGP
jgi:hypothetical protein